MLVLFETPAGFALFKVLLDEGKLDKVEDLWKEFTTSDSARKVVELKAFNKFENTSDALSAATLIIDSKPSKSLRKFLQKHCEGETLAVADSQLGNAIKEKLKIDCLHNSAVMELMRGLRNHLTELISELGAQDHGPMSLGLSHSLSRVGKMQKTKGVFGFRPRQPCQIKGEPNFWQRNWPLVFSPSMGVKMNWARAWARGRAKPWLRSKQNVSAWSTAKKLAGLPSDAIQTRPKCKRRGKDTRRSNEEKKAFKVALRLSPGFGNLSKLGESSSSELSKQVASGVSESVVSIVSLIGDTVIYECTGIFIENSCADATSILTVASFVGTPEMAITDDLTIKVRLPNDRVVIGWLHNRYLNYDLAVVNIRRTRGFQTLHLSSSHHVQFESNHKVVAVGRCFNSGMLKSTNGIVISSPTHGHSELMRATCKINQAWIGGPLVDFEGNFVGMNFRCGESTAFLPKNKILKCLGLLRNDAAVTVDNGALNRLFQGSWPPPGGVTADVMNAVKKKFLDSIFQEE